jgi:hypothetical protein
VEFYDFAGSIELSWDDIVGGQGGIRTHGELAPTPVFKTGALNRSATCPHERNRG